MLVRTSGDLRSRSARDLNHLAPNSVLRDRELSLLIAAPGVEDISQAFAEKVISHDGEKDCEARVKGKPPGHFNVILRLGQDVTPTGCRRLNSYAKKA